MQYTIKYIYFKLKKQNIMLVTEFISRTSFKPTTDEYNLIEERYMRSTLSKDEFCALWLKENLLRVNAFKAEQKAKELKERAIDKMLKKFTFGYFSIENKYKNMGYLNACKLLKEYTGKTLVDIMLTMQPNDKIQIFCCDYLTLEIYCWDKIQ